ncbi:MAG: hypothetical protein WCF10_14405 [Polyangiales bacterium]
MRWIPLVPLLLVLGCPFGQKPEEPGSPVGTFVAQGVMVVQSCGGAIPSPDPLDLQFDLRSESNGRAYFKEPGGLTFPGIEKDGAYSFEVSQSWTVIEPDPQSGYAGCAVTQRDTSAFVVEIAEVQTDGDAGVDSEPAGADAGVAPTAMTMSGSQITEISPVAGSDCTPAVTAGGPFLSLPCRIEYLLTGTGLGAE